MIYAVDFDGTLCANLYPKIGKPRAGVIEYIREAKEQGGTIILWTCRAGALLDQAVQWCRENEVPIDYVNESLPSRGAWIVTPVGSCARCALDPVAALPGGGD